MINIKLYWDKNFLTGIESSGHSGYAENGSDIICAAVSSLVQALLLGLSEVAKVEGLEYEVDAKVPVIKIFWPSKAAEELNILTRSVALSLKEIAKEQRRYVKITEYKQ